MRRLFEPTRHSERRRQPTGFTRERSGAQRVEQGMWWTARSAVSQSLNSVEPELRWMERGERGRALVR